MDRQLPKNRINLLPQELRSARGLRFFGGVVARVSLAFLGIYLISTLGLFLAIFLSSQEAKGLENKKNSLTSGLQAVQSQEGLLLTLKNRINLAGTIYNKQSPLPPDSIEMVLSILPNEVELKSIENVEGKNVFLTVTARDSKTVLNFLTVLKNDQRFSSVFLNTLGLREEGTYSFSLELK